MFARSRSKNPQKIHHETIDDSSSIITSSTKRKKKHRLFQTTKSFKYSIMTLLLIVLILSLTSLLYKFRYKYKGREQQEEEGPATVQVTSTSSLHVPSRAFPIYPHPFPCIAQKETSNTKDTGIIFIKIHKSASSTISNLVKRWSTNLAIHPNIQQCKAHYQHAFAWSLPNLHSRIKNQSFLFTFIREPTQRFMSDFNYHGISKQKLYKEANLDNFHNFTNHMKHHEFTKHYGGYTFQYMTIHKNKVPPMANPTLYWHSHQPTIVQQPHLLESHVEYLLHEYDFIGIASRMEESLVALSFILNIPLESMIYVQSKKTSGGYDFNAAKHECFFMQQIKATNDLQQYLDSDEWKASIAGDILLYHAVNLSLDKTIEYIGRETFDTRMKKYLELKTLVDGICHEAKCSRCSTSGQVIDLIKTKKDKRCKVEWCVQAARIKQKQKHT